MGNPYPIVIRDEAGVTRLGGSVDFTDPANQPGNGGSQPGALASAEFIFTEDATAGTYTASLPVLAGTVVLDVILYPLTDWACNTTQMDMGDTLTGPASYLSGAAPKGGVYDPDGLAAGDKGAKWIDLSSNGSNYGGASYKGPLDPTDFIAIAGGPGIRYAADDTITMSLVTTIAVPPVVPTGLLLVKIMYFVPVTAVAASFA